MPFSDLVSLFTEWLVVNDDVTFCQVLSGKLQRRLSQPFLVGVK